MAQFVVLSLSLVSLQRLHAGAAGRAGRRDGQPSIARHQAANGRMHSAMERELQRATYSPRARLQQTGRRANHGTAGGFRMVVFLWCRAKLT
jgi:hypothetical protein